MGKKSSRHRTDEAISQEPTVFESPPKPSRSGETLFRILSSNQTTLSQMADTKAHIMLSICAGVITLSMGRVFEPDSARYAAIILVVSALISACLAIVSTLPRFGGPPPPSPDDPRFNVLFFSHFTTLSEEEYAARMHKVVLDNVAVRDALFRDIYRQGVILARRKYRYLTICYRTFLAGIGVSGIVWLWGMWQG
jgi:hypothetical protein